MKRFDRRIYTFSILSRHVMKIFSDEIYYKGVPRSYSIYFYWYSQYLRCSTFRYQLYWIEYIEIYIYIYKLETPTDCAKSNFILPLQIDDSHQSGEGKKIHRRCTNKGNGKGLRVIDNSSRGSKMKTQRKLKSQP